MEVLRCPSCGAPIAPNSDKCEYCLNYIRTESAPSEKPKKESQKKDRQHNKAESVEKEYSASQEAIPNIAFQRVEEPNERAFTVSVPQGWSVEGGISRADLTMQMVDAQSIEAKVDFTVRNDEQATIAIRWCPTVKYCDVRMTPAAMMFPQGSNYGGMVVWPLLNPQDFMLQNLYPWAHPNIGQKQILDKNLQPSLAQNYQNKLMQLGVPIQASYQGGTSINGSQFSSTFMQVST